MFTSMDFTYDGIRSSDMGVSLVGINVESKRSFGINRKTIEEKVRDKSLIYGFEKSKLRFSISLAKLEGGNLKWTYEERKKIVEWFWREDYKPFVSLDNPEVIYYCTPTGSAERFDNGCNEGYVVIQMECDSPFAYTPTYLEVYRAEEENTNIFEIENYGNVEEFYFPEIQIINKDSTQVSIINLTTGEEAFVIENLEPKEEIYIDNENKYISSSLTEKHRLADFNKKWLKLVKGINRLEIEGNVDVAFRCVYPVAI